MSMKGSETAQEYIFRAMELVNQIPAYGEEISNSTVVTKLLKSLTSKFDNKVTAIEETKDLSKLTIEQLCGSRQAHKARFIRSGDKTEEKALQVKGEGRSSKLFEVLFSRGRG